ncbi:hypothetical protein L2E82_35522 [Cichorium intybus]|uniref:Uncharacterized protein n=1 Tax=Cichorium intybus TaxID=13427 RepID=A0ACB9BP33_CICIN|nr:hypothetical protein L2E82_35522 [Cichorium intybus]
MENELKTCLKELIIGDFLTINDVALADPILSKSKLVAAIVLESRDNKEVLQLPRWWGNTGLLHSFPHQNFAGRERINLVEKLFNTHHDLFSWENLEMVKVQNTHSFFDYSLERHVNAQSSGSVLSRTMEDELKTYLRDLVIEEFLTINDVALAEPILSKSEWAAYMVLKTRDKEAVAKNVKKALV